MPHVRGLLGQLDAPAFLGRIDGVKEAELPMEKSGQADFSFWHQHTDLMPRTIGCL
jgi:hypothetical protein